MAGYFKYQPRTRRCRRWPRCTASAKMASSFSPSTLPEGHPKIPNEEVASCAPANADVAIPFASIDPARGEEGRSRGEATYQRLRRARVQVPSQRQGFLPNSPLAYPLYEAIAAATLPALFHTGQTGWASGSAAVASSR